MIAIVCVDDKGGMTFNGRRQSQDRILRARLMEQFAPHSLWMNQYSAGQFEPSYAHRLHVSEDFLEQAGRGTVCFVENCPLHPYQNKLEKIVLFRWNRVYPADTWLDLSLDEEGWHLVNCQEFSGSSHKTITQEVYEK